MGPTAAGKTDFARRLAELFPIEVISVDSALVYRKLNIGSAKPTPALLARCPHHLIDIREPHEGYSAADFRHDALVAIDAIRRRGNIAMLVGGTGLYFRTLEQGIAELPRVPREIRESLRDEWDKLGPQVMHAKLQAVDPLSANRIHPNDPQRLLRALEIYRCSNKSLSQYLAEQQVTPFPYRILKLICAPAEKESLHGPIAARFHQMLAAGFVNEVIKLRQDSRLSLKLPALRAVGYRAMWQYLDGDIDRHQMVHDGIVGTRRLAKRQYTWFRREAGGTWVDAYESGTFERLKSLINEAVFSG